MQFNTALGLSGLGLALFSLCTYRFRAARVFAFSIAALGLLTLVQYLYRIDLGIDQLFRSAFTTGLLRNPGRMAHNTAVSLIASGVAVWILSTPKRNPRSLLLAGFIGLLPIGLGIVKTVSYIFGAKGSVDPASFLHMALPTAIAVGISGSLILLTVYLWLRDAKKYAHWLRPFYVTSLLFFATLGLWQLLLNQEIAHLANLVRSQSESVRGMLGLRLSNSTYALKRFGTRVEYLGSRDHRYLELDAKSYLEHLNLLKQMGLADSGGKPYWVYSPEKLGNFNHLNPKANLELREVVADSKLKYSPSMSHFAFQPEGGGNFYVSVPLRKSGVSLGYLYAEMNGEKLFKDLVKLNDFSLKIYDSDQVIFWTKDENGIVTELSDSSNLSWGLASLMITVTPTHRFVEANRTLLPFIILYGGSLVSLLVGFFLQSVGYTRRQEHSYLRRMEDANQEIEKANQVLENLKDRLEIALQDSGIGVWEWTIPSNVLIWDDQMFKIYGLNRFDFGKDYQMWIKQIHPEDAKDVVDAMNDALVGRDEFKHEFRIITSNGKISYVLGRGKVLRDPLGSPLKMIGINWDITQIKQNEQALILAKQMANQAAEAKSSFLANMSHEIRTPLNAVIGMADLMLETKLTADQRQFSMIIQQSGTALLGLINDILDFSKIEAGKLTLENAEFQIAHLVESQAELMILRAERKNISLMTFIDPNMPVFYAGDAARIGQVLLNLMGNAVKFTERGGVSVRVVPSKRSSESGDRSRVRFEIIDTGIGLSEESQQKLFQPFTQASGVISQKYGGTGLGLSISKRLVQAMGGEIGVLSSETKGAIFWFEIPLSRTREGATKSELRSKIENVRIMIVDDDETVQGIMGDYFSSWNMNWKSHLNFQNVIQHIRDGEAAGVPYDVVVLGQGKLKEEGLPIGREIRESFGDASPKILLMEHFGISSDPSPELMECFDGIIYKPVKQSQLFDSLVNAVTGVHAESVAPEKTRDSIVSESGRSAFRILVADDVAANQLLTLKLLMSLGYSANAVGNGKEVLESLVLGGYDLILMDCQMPEMDGFQATKMIRTQEGATGTHIPIIALTANAMAGDDRKCLAAGMDGYLSKPIKKDRLGEMLSKWLIPKSEEKKAA